MVDTHQHIFPVWLIHTNIFFTLFYKGDTQGVHKKTQLRHLFNGSQFDIFNICAG